MNWIRVEGSSMRPYLSSGTWIGVAWTEPQAAEPPAMGEIVLCRDRHGEWIVHRVVGRKRDERGVLLIKGDAALGCDEFAPSEIWGRVRAIRSGGEGEGRPFRRIWLDACIARVSLWSTLGNRLAEKVLRRVVAGLAYVRRAL